MLAERISNYYDSDLSPQFMADNRPVSIMWASTMQLKEVVFSIRYQVYCEQLGYENTTQNTSKMEMDQFDGWSKHLLIRDDLTSKFVGTMRIVEPQHHKHTIPIESHYEGSYVSPALHPAELNAGRYVEISRLAVNPQPAGMLSARYATDVSKLLYLTAIAYFQKSIRLSELYWLAEQRLARRLSILGLPSERIGTFVEYRGQRAPFIMKKEKLRFPEHSSKLAFNTRNRVTTPTILKPIPLNFKSACKATYQQILDHRLYLPPRQA